MSQAEEKRFEVSFPFSIEEVKDGNKTPFFTCDLKYYDMPYDGVVAIQAAMLELLERLQSYGEAQVDASGLGKKLEVLKGKKDKK